MKRILSLLLAAVIVAALCAACGNKSTGEPATPDSAPAVTEQPTEAATSPADGYGTVHTLYFKDSFKSDTATATFFNSVSSESMDVVMTKIGEDADSVTYSCEGDCAAYNMVSITCSDKKIDAVAFNPCTSGWYRTDDGILPFAYGAEIDYLAQYDYVKLTGYGYDKNIYIWKPDDYDPASDEKYATVYMLDGQGMAYFGWNYQPLKGCPVMNAQIEAMTASTGKKAILVCIESDVARANELIPKIGTLAAVKEFGLEEQEYDCMDGTQFGDFVAHTLVPYVQEHYNVYTDALHTAVAGCSFGGVEAFYIPLEYPEVFGTAGAMSPSLFVYDEETWREYLGKKSFGSESPYLYIYTGGENDTDKEGKVTAMVGLLKELGYPEDKIAFHYYDEGIHSSVIWRYMLPEFLTGMVYRCIVPLQK